LKYIFIIVIIFYFSKNKTNHLITILEHKPNGACKIRSDEHNNSKRKCTNYLLDNQHLIENHQYLITIKQNHLQLIRIIIISTIQISSLSNIF